VKPWPNALGEHALSYPSLNPKPGRGTALPGREVRVAGRGPVAWRPLSIVRRLSRPLVARNSSRERQIFPPYYSVTLSRGLDGRSIANLALYRWAEANPPRPSSPRTASAKTVSPRSPSASACPVRLFSFMSHLRHPTDAPQPDELWPTMSLSLCHGGQGERPTVNLAPYWGVAAGNVGPRPEPGSNPSARALPRPASRCG
jgi:hypothetical protein